MWCAVDSDTWHAVVSSTDFYASAQGKNAPEERGGDCFEQLNQLRIRLFSLCCIAIVSLTSVGRLCVWM